LAADPVDRAPVKKEEERGDSCRAHSEKHCFRSKRKETIVSLDRVHLPKTEVDVVGRGGVLNRRAK